MTVSMERQIRQAGRSDGEQREHEEPEQTGQQASVAQRVVVLAPKVKQQHAGDDQQRPVAVDVNRVDDVLEQFGTGHGAAGSIPPRRPRGSARPASSDAAFSSARSTRPSVTARTPKYVR